VTNPDIKLVSNTLHLWTLYFIRVILVTAMYSGVVHSLVCHLKHWMMPYAIFYT
jgi:hypothetical protein